MEMDKNDIALSGDEDTNYFGAEPLDISFPEMEVEDESKKSDTKEDGQDDKPKTDEVDSSKEIDDLLSDINDDEEDTKEDPKEDSKEEPKEDKKDSDEEEDDLDLSELFAELEDATKAADDSKDTIDRISEQGEASPADIEQFKRENAELRDSLEKVSKLLSKSSTDKLDLMYKNAELEAFGWTTSDPSVLIISKNIEKAKAGDDKAKSKVVSILKTLLEDFTWEDFESAKLEKDTDILAAADKYNTSVNPNMKANKENEIEWMSM